MTRRHRRQILLSMKRLAIWVASCAVFASGLLWPASHTLTEVKRISLSEGLAALEPGQSFFPQDFGLSPDGRYLALSYEVVQREDVPGDPDFYASLFDLSTRGQVRSLVTCNRAVRMAVPFMAFVGDRFIADKGYYDVLLLKPNEENACSTINLNRVARPAGTRLRVDFGAAAEKAGLYAIAVVEGPDEERGKALPPGWIDLPPPRLLFFEKATDRFVRECQSPGWVSQLDVSPSAKYVAVLDRISAGRKYAPTVSVVNATDCTLVSTFALPAVPHTVRFFPDEQRIATSLISRNRDAAIDIWDIKTGKALESFRDRRSGTSGSFDVSPDGKWIVVHTTREKALWYKEGTKIVDSGFQLWHVRSRRMIAEVRFRPESNWPVRVTFTADAKQIVALTSDLVLRFYEIPSLE